MKSLKKLENKSIKNIKTVKGGTYGDTYDNTINSTEEKEVVVGFGDR